MAEPRARGRFIAAAARARHCVATNFVAAEAESGICSDCPPPMGLKMTQPSQRCLPLTGGYSKP